eukprot:GHVN01003607.1.p1 GENE.GHVN01003607.1~~GHVN01003607.1.p1  ORF type:complete len:390 (+),score=68.60 GHVN01003607.1:59-1228(+)
MGNSRLFSLFGWVYPSESSKREAGTETASRPQLTTAGISSPSVNPSPRPSLVAVNASETTETSAASPPAAEAPKEDPLSPIQYDMFRREFQQLISQDNFDGFRLEAGKQVTPQLQASHTLMLGTTLREGGYMYQFGPTFASEENNLFIFSRLGTDGVTNGRIIKRIPHTDKTKSLSSLASSASSRNSFTELKANFASSLTEEQSNLYEIGAASTFDSCAASLTAAWQGTWFLNSSFSQVISPRLHLGGELTWIAAQGATTASLGGRYNYKNNFWSGSVSRSPDFKSSQSLLNNVHGAKFQYLRKVNERLSLGAELDVNTDLESALKMGYDYTFKTVARVQGCLDTGGKVSMFCQDNTGFGVSGHIDFRKGDYKFGFIMHMVPQQDAPPE